MKITHPLYSSGAWRQDVTPSTRPDDRYKELAKVERDFRTLKTGHLEFRPWFVCKEENTHAHALTSMLALKVRRRLEKAWWPIEVTVEEGVRELENWRVMELIHPETQAVVSRQVPEPNARQERTA